MMLVEFKLGRKMFTCLFGWLSMRLRKRKRKKKKKKKRKKKKKKKILEKGKKKRSINNCAK